MLRETALDTGSTLHVRSEGSNLHPLPTTVSIRGTSGATQSVVGVGVTSIGEHVLPRDVFAVVPSTPLDLLSLGRLARLHGYKAFLSFEAPHLVTPAGKKVRLAWRNDVLTVPMVRKQPPWWPVLLWNSLLLGNCSKVGGR